MKSIVWLVVLSVSAVAFAATAHGVALVVTFLALAVLILDAVREEPEPLAPYRFPGGDR